MNRWLGLLLGVTVLVLLLAPGQAPIAAEAHPDVGYRAPAVQARDLAGQSVSLESLRGQVVVLNFWATWCPPCRAEMPELQNLSAAQLPGVALVGVNLTAQEVSPAAVGTFLQAHGYTYPVWLDLAGDAADTYRVRTVPTTFFLDTQGVIRHKYLGPMTRAELLAGIRAAGGNP